MTTNFYFSNFESSSEQELIEDLVIESIRIYGHNLWYIPRTLTAEDNILNEDDLSTFDEAYMIEMYIKNVDGFEGEGDFLSKFGLQIRDSITFTCAMRTFEFDVSRVATETRQRPFEGDLIYFPLHRKLWKVMHVEHEAIFYQLGALQMYDLRCELFEYSNERFNTGVEEIDTLLTDYDRTANTSMTALEVSDPFADNKQLQDEATQYLDFSSSNPFGSSEY